ASKGSSKVDMAARSILAPAPTPASAGELAMAVPIRGFCVASAADLRRHVHPSPGAARERGQAYAVCASLIARRADAGLKRETGVPRALRGGQNTIERLFVRQSLKFRAAGHGGRVERDGSRRQGGHGRR